MFADFDKYKYRFSHNKRKDYSYEELKNYFFIDGSEVIYCKKDFGNCKKGRYFLISEGAWYGGWGEEKTGFIVHDWPVTYGGYATHDPGYESWIDKEYMKEAI